MKQMSEHVSANIVLQMGIVVIIAHNRQFVHTTNSAYHSILRRIVTQSVKQMSEHVSADSLLLVGFVGIIAHK